MSLRKEGTRLSLIGLSSLLAFSVFFACSTSVGKDETMKRLTPEDNGREIVVRMDERFEVALPEIPTSGYQWIVHRIDADFLKLEREDYAARPEPEKGLVGARETKLFVFRALKEGDTKFELWLRRSWEDPATHIEAFEVTLKILSP